MLINLSVDGCVSSGMRQACYHLYTEVGKKFPDLCATAVGGFFFLRFVCPAIIAPEQYSLVNGAFLIGHASITSIKLSF